MKENLPSEKTLRKKIVASDGFPSKLLELCPYILDRQRVVKIYKDLDNSPSFERAKMC